MIALCDEGTPGGPAWLWGGVGAWAEPLMSSWGWGRWQEGGQAVPCGMFTDCTPLLTDEHLVSFQTRVTVRRKQSLPSSYSIDFVQYVSIILISWSVGFSFSKKPITCDSEDLLVHDFWISTFLNNSY